MYEKYWPGNSAINVAKKVLTTNLIADPLFFFPTFYTFREVLSHTGKHEPLVLTKCAQRGWANYLQNWPADWFNSWAVWLPSHALIYGFCPLHLRMPAVAGVSFGYVGLLSYTRGKPDDDSTSPSSEPTEVPSIDAKTSEVKDGAPSVAANGDVVYQR